MKNYFDKFKMNIIGDGYKPQFNEYGKKIIYADWAASGRLYHDIEMEIIDNYGPLYSNFHSEGNYISYKTELAYNQSKNIIRIHFGANDNYAVIACGHGMTSAINRLQMILINQYKNSKNIIIFLTPYEHNSNFITWKNNNINCVILKLKENGQIDLNDMEIKLKKYFKNENVLIGFFCACSNVNGVKVDLLPLCNLMKLFSGIVCVDYTTIAPYDVLNIEKLRIDALVFSTHKFVGGVGGPGILIISKDLYKLKVPTQVGGGTVKWINPWGEILYKDNIEEREEAGTPPILPVIKAGLAIKLKEKIGVDNIVSREIDITKKMLSEMKKIRNIVIYDSNIENRLPIISFNFINVSYIEGVKILDQKYGIQVRGGCCCASIYGHHLLNISSEESNIICQNIIKNEEKINKKGWIRVSLSPFVLDDEIYYICDSIRKIADGMEEYDKESKGNRRKLS
ncbi:aminotransferase class V-fold PLP-dependent enzyme [Anaerocolumna chitinilytica]|uniref:Selenocysteine lyase n=1 Tax=Anaerocolumna chitinilytica TaxID=1727145 RepID=A0A7I8DM34_9FIRM|nr:aminotransferase class V-fold PLP-dependent enzyme [Anaerocolumna chitinilytica]BCJ98341.1 selenocysteine lyase [Anaerocolumna chitinilytica]